MDPLITNGVDPVLLGGLEKRGLEKRGDERLAALRRKRIAALPPSAEAETEVEADPDLPHHTLDDMA